MNKLFFMLILLVFNCEIVKDISRAKKINDLEKLKYTQHKWMSSLEAITFDNQRIFVKSMATWRIHDSERLYRTVLDIDGAESSLANLLNGIIRDVLSKQSFKQGIDNYLPEGEIIRITKDKLEEMNLGFQLDHFKILSILPNPKYQSKSSQ